LTKNPKDFTKDFPPPMGKALGGFFLHNQHITICYWAASPPPERGEDAPLERV